ncbi:5-dehydro-4-deoxyglucarate dehydratase [Microbacterium schleiferi]|uniref:Probable 5-dehydro-4-deoxyglucarate dehydratase n=1 Tax=Microbacterium schleiferi TaxID=69362 RepID=A0ABU7V4F9_9MICO
MTSLNFANGVLFFPVTPFSESGAVELDRFSAHVESRLEGRPGGVFAACGTGEFHALSSAEAAMVVSAAVETVAGRVPVIAGVGGCLGAAIEGARAAAKVGADGLLLLPPYLVAGTTAGLVAWVRAVMSATDLPVIVYHRATARFTPSAILELAADPRLVGFKDGIGDIALAQEIALTSKRLDRPLAMFNGLLTAELSQSAYRAIGVPLYSSAAFAMIPEVANVFYHAYSCGNDEVCEDVLRRFYQPLVALRDETPGFGVSLIKAGLRLRGFDVGSVRPPLVDPTHAQLDRLQEILDEGFSLSSEYSQVVGAR